MTLDVKPLQQALGAVVHGWEPKATLSQNDEATIRQSLADHSVLVFRGQTTPTDDEMIAFAQRFGDLVKGSEWFGDIDARPEILRVTNLVDDEGVAKGIGASESLEWHADYSYAPAVGKESFLEAVEIPNLNPPQTCFCSQYSAYDRLPQAMVKMLRPLTAHHSITSYAKGQEKGEESEQENSEDYSVSENPRAGTDFRAEFQAKRERNQRLGVSHPDIPEAEHPIILRHPQTGRELLYVSKGITRHIIGMPEDESKALLKELAAHSTAPEYVYAHDWQVGDLVMFDTLGTLHRRDAWDPTERRMMRQMSTRWTPTVDGVGGEHALN
ncbi:MAG: TauD/TfdA family dioxygenase [Rhodospirillaceae bacterium]|jgi:alpha-ketoglutarate-dependent taurine dioxygenase|nr:TauD/TfdA family dioxygenase [Rhodospirillaceae bacterium]MBT4690251.1 TauD/TfdA family dioxygenase [Rhodospirillaceae bacterium]MBT5082797.1 TauD/TfdA family dioxygenase [Rhodospirillaceae bacterium]MBT5527299.1 TauD/TfdA family dioxygenase [Rhodospirillaceae bacterium]MBT5879374.1 TauD/TfdA family dioxygenase [Rhodospirillaceae bacterium]